MRYYNLPVDKMEFRETKVGTHKHGKGCTGRETTARQIYQRVREFPNEALCERTTAVLQLPEVWSPGQDLQVRGPDLQVLRWKTRIDPVQGQQKSNTKVRKLWTWACHHQSEHQLPAIHIKLIHWNAQGTITKTSAIKTANVQDDLDIVMIQDTRYKRRLDDLPYLRIHGYHTHHKTMDEGGHGMVTMIKNTIPSEEAEQIHLGDGTETLSTRIWLNNKPLLLHTIYRVVGELDITTTLTREPR